MGVTEALRAAGFKAERSTIGDKLIYEGVYKATLFDVRVQEDRGYGPSILASFKIQETLAGQDSISQYPEFRDWYSTDPQKINSKRNGLAKLINGLFSVGVELNQSSDEAFLSSLEAARGTSVFVKGYKKEPVKKDEAGNWVEDSEGEIKQGFTFLTEKNALREVKKAGAPF